MVTLPVIEAPKPSRRLPPWLKRDLPDGGAEHFYRCVRAVRARTGAVVEVLTPDFLGDVAAIERVLEAKPEVFNHNTETVPRFYKKVRGRADYRRSLDLLGHVKKL